MPLRRQKNQLMTEECDRITALHELRLSLPTIAILIGYNGRTQCCVVVYNVVSHEDSGRSTCMPKRKGCTQIGIFASIFETLSPQRVVAAVNEWSSKTIPDDMLYGELLTASLDLTFFHGLIEHLWDLIGRDMNRGPLAHIVDDLRPSLDVA
ncbi:hypothetical protein TNCV_1161691 [Trichonephila clavipes]|nr:hypothetical protein TNCV_1161691 [Trichonephila clavipes]